VARSWTPIGAGSLLLRLSNVGSTVSDPDRPGLTFKQVSTGARHMRGTDGRIWRPPRSTSGGGEHGRLIDTTGVPAGTYILQTTELHQMSNRNEMDGGMIAEIVVQ
jgi:hypothetical protein